MKLSEENCFSLSLLYYIQTTIGREYERERERESGLEREREKVREKGGEGERDSEEGRETEDVREITSTITRDTWSIVAMA